MSSNKKPPGNIHKIREFELEKITLSDEFDILQIVGEGWFGKILLVEHRATDTEMVLKALPKPYVSLRDFYREFHYGLHLGLHKNIVTTYDVAFETAGFYVFTQEYALLGDLTSNVSDSGIGELHSKKVAKQIASALDYMHSKDIVHRDVKLDNVLIYKSDFSRVKLCDFGESYRTGTVVERRNEWLPYSPPEVLQIKPEGTYAALPSHDVWQFAIVIFVCLTGCLPWQKAASDDPRYVRYLAWQGINIMIPLRRTPKLFKLLSNKGSRMFRKFLEPRPERRPKNLSELSRFLDDRWLAKGAEKDMAEYEPDELCPSMYSFHSSPEEKNKVLWLLAEQGIETTVDRKAKKIRIKDWIESSVILEDDEEEDSGSASASPSSSVSREPVAGHISSVRAATTALKTNDTTTNNNQKINTTIKDAAKKHFDPRTGIIQQGPSEMGTIYRNQSLASLATTITTGGLASPHSSLNSSLITLGSRNNLIMSEGQPFTNSEMNLDMKTILDDDQHNDDLMLPPMVNSNLKNLPMFNNNNNNINNNLSNSALMPKNNLHTFSNTDLTLHDNNIINTQQKTVNNTNQNNNNSNNINKRSGPKPIQRTKSDSVQKILQLSNNSLLLNDNKQNQLYASTSSINLINNNLNSNSINGNNLAHLGLSAFKTNTTISVPEFNSKNQQNQQQLQQQQQQQQQLQNERQQFKQQTKSRLSISPETAKYNGYKQDKMTGTLNIVHKHIGSPVFKSRKTNTIINSVELSRSQGNLANSLNFRDNGGKLMLSLPKRNDASVQTMKDTPYDRLK